MSTYQCIEHWNNFFQASKHSSSDIMTGHQCLDLLLYRAKRKTIEVFTDFLTYDTL